MDEPVQTEIVVALARVEGEMRGIRENVELRLDQHNARLEREVAASHTEHARLEARLDAQDTRMDVHHEQIDGLESVKDRMWGAAWAVGSLSGVFSAVVVLVLERIGVFGPDLVGAIIQVLGGGAA